MGFTTAAIVAEQRAELIKVTSGCKELDDILEGTRALQSRKQHAALCCTVLMPLAVSLATSSSHSRLQAVCLLGLQWCMHTACREAYRLQAFSHACTH